MLGFVASWYLEIGKLGEVEDTLRIVERLDSKEMANLLVIKRMNVLID